MPLVREINSLCVVWGGPPGQSDALLARGAELPLDWQAGEAVGFFAPGLAFRVPGFLATSFEEMVRALAA